VSARPSRQPSFVSLLPVRAGIAIVLALVLSLAPAARAGDTPDPIAPPGAPGHWLPSSPWVMEHWLPYDERELYRLIGSSRTEIVDHLASDRRTVAELARERGWAIGELASKLMATRRGISAAKRRKLRQRAIWTLTQGHLGQHMFRHSLHTNSLPKAYPSIFGVEASKQFMRLRLSGLSPYRIANRHGISGRRVRARAATVLRRSARRGVARGEMSGHQANVLVARQVGQLRRWLRSGGKDWHMPGGINNR
jgi:hypothetical protein